MAQCFTRIWIVVRNNCDRIKVSILNNKKNTSQNTHKKELTFGSKKMRPD